MKHHKKNRKFNRSKNQREALLSSLSSNLINKEKIKTTLAKAKEIRPFIERLVTHSKIDSVQKRRLVLKRLDNNKKATFKIFDKIGPKYKDRNGGYVRIIKLGQRKSDGAEMSIIEFV